MQHCPYANFGMYTLNLGMALICTEYKSGDAIQSDLELISALS